MPKSEIINWYEKMPKDLLKTPDNPNLETVVNNYKAAKVAADKVFLMAMKDASPHVPNWKIKAAYNAVVVFGRWSIIPTQEELYNT